MIGLLRHRFTIKKQVRTQDAGGGFITIWAPILNAPKVWGSLATAGSSFGLQGQQQRMTDNSFRVRIRYREDLKPAMRLELGNRVFEIETLQDPDDRKKMLDIAVTEVF